MDFHINDSGCHQSLATQFSRMTKDGEHDRNKNTVEDDQQWDEAG